MERTRGEKNQKKIKRKGNGGEKKEGRAGFEVLIPRKNRRWLRGAGGPLG